MKKLIVLTSLMMAVLIAGCDDQNEKIKDAKISTLEKQIEDTRNASQKLREEASRIPQLRNKTAELEAEIQRLNKENERLAKELDALRSVKREDTEYLVIRREHILGKLVDKTPARSDYSSPNDPFQTRSTPIMRIGRDWERTNPSWKIYLKGIQTSKEYPAIEVKESEYTNFIEGATCSRIDINRAKLR